MADVEARSSFSNAISDVISAAYSKDHPPTVTIKVLRVPADGTRPQSIELETTHEGVESA